MECIECGRCLAAQKFGFVKDWKDARTKSTSAPKVAIISKPQDYIDLDGNEMKSQTMDVCCRAISVGSLHKAYPMTVTIATGAAVRIPGTIANELVPNAAAKETIRLGHTSGVTEVKIKMDGEKVLSGGVIRTARRIMDGFVYVRD